MTPPIEDHINSRINNPEGADSGLNAGQDWTSKMNPEQMFQLIDSIMPVEICLYHQVLPLSIEGSRLNLGMVNPHDDAALDYIRRIVAYVNYTLAPRHIPSAVHQSMLSAYLNYVGKESSFGNETEARSSQAQRSSKAKSTSASGRRSESAEPASRSASPADPAKAPELAQEAPSQVSSQAPSQTQNLPVQELPQVDVPEDALDDAPVLDDTFEEQNSGQTYTQDDTDPGSRATLIVDRLDQDDDSHADFDPGNRETLIVDLPGRLQEDSFGQTDAESTEAPVETPPPPLPPRRIPPAPRPPTLDSLTQLAARKAVSADVTAAPSSKPRVEPPQNRYQPGLAELKIEAKNLDQPLETLQNLAPYNLLQELLARVLSGGIGRLFFERQADRARILWSQNGEIQAAINQLDFAQFQGVIDELKIMANLPVLPVQKSRQIEIERLYQGSQLLLRFRLMPGTYGEEATLQVLRGAALKFHQQQHISGLEQDAIVLARQLQRKLDEIYNRAEMEPSSFEVRQESLVTLQQVIQIINGQISGLSKFGPETASSD